MIKIGVIGCGKWSTTVINEINKNRNFIFSSIVCRKNKINYSEENIYIYKIIKI